MKSPQKFYKISGKTVDSESQIPYFRARKAGLSNGSFVLGKLKTKGKQNCMKLHKPLLGAIAAAVLFGQATASACFVPVCHPNPGNCGYKPPVSDCGGTPPKCDPKPIKIVVIIIIKLIFKGFGC